MADPVVRKAGADQEPAQKQPAQPAAGGQQMVTLEEATIMARNAANEAVAQALSQMKSAGSADVPAPNITIQQSTSGPPQIRPSVHITKPEDQLEEDVVYEVNMRTFILSPFTDPTTGKFYGTPGNQTVVFKLVGARQQGDKTQVVARYKTRDSAWCRAIEGRPDFGIVINKRGDSVLSRDGMRTACVMKWQNQLSNKSHTELIALVDRINKEAGRDAVPYSVSTEDIRNNLVGYYVRLEIDGDHPAAGRPATPEGVIEALATR